MSVHIVPAIFIFSQRHGVKVYISFLGLSAKTYTIYQKGDKLATVRDMSTLRRASQKIQNFTGLKVMNNNNNTHYVNKYLLGT